MKRIFSLLAATAVCCSLCARRMVVEGILAGGVPEGRLSLFIVPVTGADGQEADTLHVVGGKFRGECEVSPWGIYRIVAVRDRSQSFLPVAVAEKDGKAYFSLAFDEEGNPRVADGGADTEALAAFNSFHAATLRRLWTDGKNMEDAALDWEVTSLLPAADSIISRYGASPVAACYLRLWAATATYEAIEGLRFSTGRDPAAIGLGEASRIGELCAPADCDLSAAFRPQVSRMVLASLPDGSLDERIGAVKARFGNEQVRQAAIDRLLTQYVNDFPYAARYEEGLSELAALTRKHGLDARYLEEFRTRKVSIPGSPFPGQATLFDLDGREVDFARYRGKYVYVDLWASWCVPCIREIPVLKRLEAELENKDVVFLSISLDEDEAAWKRKVGELSLKGNLLVDRGGLLAKALRVRGIPFFLIYDREGKLLEYGAPRPSSADIKPKLEALGK